MLADGRHRPVVHVGRSALERNRVVVSVQHLVAGLSMVNAQELRLRTQGSGLRALDSALRAPDALPTALYAVT